MMMTDIRKKGNPMSTLETMTLDEVEAALAALRARRKMLKSASTVAQRKIVTLARRRERLMQQVHALDAQMAYLRGGQPQEAPVHPPITPQPRRTRRNQAKA